MLLATDGRVGLRRYAPDDVAALYEAVDESRAALAPWMPWCPPEYSIRDAEEWVAGRAAEWDAGIDYSVLVVDARDGRILGSSGFNQVNAFHRFANLGYWVRTSASGCGVATAAVRMAARYGFERLGFGRAEIVVATGNVASCRVAERAGAHREGVLRDRLRFGDAWHDAVMYSLTPADFA